LAPLILVPVVLRERANPARVLLPLIVGLSLASVYAFFQYRYGVTFGAKLSGAGIERWQELAPGSEDRFVAGGFFFHRLKFAHALVIGLLAALFTLDRFKWPVVALLLCALWLSFARAAFVAFVLAAGVTLVIERRVKLKKSALLLLIPVVIAASMPQVLARLGSLTSRASYGDRAFIWERAFEIVKDHPVFGVGFGNYSRVCSAYYDRVDPTFVMRSQAHNQFLTFWAETGPLGALLFAALLVLCFFFARHQPDPALRAFATAAVIATSILSLVHDPLAHGVTGVLLCAALGLGVSRRGAPA
jgi:O-antigen ligase